MRARKILILTIGFLALGALAQGDVNNDLSPPSNDILDNVDSWPVTGYTCEQLAAFRLARDQDQCLDLSEVVLTAELGAENNYRNACLADLYNTQALLS